MTLMAGVARVDITPTEPVFLFGYPHVPRISTGVHDPLYASALYLGEGARSVVLMSIDVLMLNPETAIRCRRAVQAATGVPQHRVLLSTTHTHSGPVTAKILAFRDDTVVPGVDPAYLDQICTASAESASEAIAGAHPAQVAVASATADGVGSNRHDPDGPADPEVGIVAVRDAGTGAIFALDLVYAMHPTVLHEDSTLVSADFPGYVRAFLSEALPGLVTVYHTGASGNQSPRYTVSEQSFAEAERLGKSLGRRVWSTLQALPDHAFSNSVELDAAETRVRLPGRAFPSVEEAEQLLTQAQATYERLRCAGVPHGPVRTAEVDIFGAQERVTLARAQASGELDALIERYANAPVQAVRIGDAVLVGLPGEIFVEYGLAIRARLPHPCFVISLANGELQGYIVTPGTVGYEASTSLFQPEAGDILVRTAVTLASDLMSAR